MNSIQMLSEKRTCLMGIAMLFIMLFHQSWIWGTNPIYLPFIFFEEKSTKFVVFIKEGFYG